MNLDQTPSKFARGCKATQAKIGSTTFPIAGSTEKKAINLTFVIALNGVFRPIQAIYEGKTTRCLPLVKFRNPSALVPMKIIGEMIRRVLR